MQINITFTWGELNVIPPRCRNPRTVDRTDTHVVDVPMLSAAEAPVALRVPVRSWRRETGPVEQFVDYRWFGEHLYVPMTRRTGTGNGEEHVMAGSVGFPFEVEHREPRYNSAYGIPRSALSLDDAIASIDAWWGIRIVVDGMVWERSREPQYALRSYSVHDGERRVTTEIITDANPSRDAGARLYAATDVETLIEDGEGTARRRRIADGFHRHFDRIEVLLPDAVRATTTPYFDAMPMHDLDALRSTLREQHVRPEREEALVRDVIDALVQQVGFAGAQGALASHYVGYQPSETLRAALVAAGAMAAEQPNIVRTTFTFTVVHPAAVTLEDIQAALAESFDGDAVGRETDRVTVPLGDAIVADELVALGNDGTFFDRDTVAG